MKKIALACIVPVFSVCASTLSMDNIVLYASDSDKKKPNETYNVAYVLKGNPCVTVKAPKYEKISFCKITDKINLETTPSAFVYNLNVGWSTASFSVYSDLGEQRCQLIMSDPPLLECSELDKKGGIK